MTEGFHPMGLPAGYRTEKVQSDQPIKKPTRADKRKNRHLRDRIALYGPGGALLSTHHNLNGAVTKAERHAAEARVKVRPCITCSRTFRSTGPGHRMCAECRQNVREDCHV
jgi:hypothetical protein